MTIERHLAALGGNFVMRRLIVALAVWTAVGCGSTGPMVADAGVCGLGGKTPPNLLQNASFECDGADAWSAVYGSLEIVAGGRTGRAAKVTVAQAGGRLAYAKTFAPEPGRKTYCFSAWVSGTAPFMRMRVLRDFGGSVQEVAFSDQLSAEFHRVPTLTVSADGAPKLALVFEVQTNRSDGQNATAGQTLWVDDADVWESSSNCAEQR
jgi:hypothetical protein